MISKTGGERQFKGTSFERVYNESKVTEKNPRGSDVFSDSVLDAVKNAYDAIGADTTHVQRFINQSLETFGADGRQKVEAWLKKNNIEYDRVHHGRHVISFRVTPQVWEKIKRATHSGELPANY